MEGPSLIDSFLDYIVVEKGLSENTRSSYCRDLLRFNAYIIEKGASLERASPEDISGFLKYLKEAGLSVGSYTRGSSPSVPFTSSSLKKGI